MKRTLTLALPVLALVMLLGTSSHSGAVGPTGVSPLPPVTQTDGRAGLCYSYYPHGETERAFVTPAHDAGSRWDRFDFVWPVFEQAQGVWSADTFDNYDDLVNDLDAVGFDMVGILLWTPEWAGTGGVSALSLDERPQRPPGWYAPVPRHEDTLEPLSFPTAWASPPQNLYEPWYSGWKDGHEGPVNYWGRFVYTLVDHYGDRVKHWEMWNEPEWRVFWTGTSSDYAQLLKVGYQATKAACSDCQVLFGGLHYWINTDYYKWVLNTLRADSEAAANNHFFDVMSVHLYSRSSNTYDVIKEIRGAMLARGMSQPIWITETGVPVWGDPYGWVPGLAKYDWSATPEEAAAYTIQSYANALASGVERYFFFRTNDDWCDKNRDGTCDDDDDIGMTELFGIIRDDGTLRPSYAAYQVATRYLISPRFVDRRLSNGTRQVTLWGTPWGKVSVLWNTTPNNVTFDYPATLPTARRVDHRGHEQIIEAVNAEDGTYVYRFDNLPGATANLVSEPHDFFIGGAPYLVIEEDTQPPSKAVVEPLPATTISSTVTIACSAQDDLSGIWGYELEIQKDGGPWRRWGQLRETPITYTDGEHGGSYCFRVRAWDRVGNPGPWSDRPRCTTLDWTRELHVRVPLVFGDEDGDGHKSDDEPTLEDLSFRLLDQQTRSVVAEGSGGEWHFTKSDALLGERYVLNLTPRGWPSPPPGWLPAHVYILIEGYGAVEVTGPIGLRAHVASHFLPTIVVGR